jgi:hypothetical protein
VKADGVDEEDVIETHLCNGDGLAVMSFVRWSFLFDFKWFGIFYMQGVVRSRLLTFG